MNLQNEIPPARHDRRGALRLIIAAIAAGLTRPLRLFAAGPQVELKYYHTIAGRSRLIYAEPLATPVVEAFTARAGGEIELLWYDAHGTLLGRTRLAPDLMAKLERVTD